MEDNPFNLYDHIIADLYSNIIDHIENGNIQVRYDESQESKFFFRFVLSVAAIQQKPVYVKCSPNVFWRLKKQFPNNNIKFIGLLAFNGLTMSYRDFLAKVFLKYNQSTTLISDINQAYYGGEQL